MPVQHYKPAIGLTVFWPSCASKFYATAELPEHKLFDTELQAGTRSWDDSYEDSKIAYCHYTAAPHLLPVAG